MLTGNASDLHRAGESAETVGPVGSLTCVGCGYRLSLASIDDDVPRCPGCGGTRFKRTSIFEQPTVDVAVMTPPAEAPAWLERVRAECEPGPHVAFADDDETRVVRLDQGWTRIGRSGSADVRLDDPTVSRRHALVVRTPAGELRALDDRSLNGLFVNGERVDWVRLSDGDELEIGRYRLYVIDC